MATRLDRRAPADQEHIESRANRIKLVLSSNEVKPLLPPPTGSSETAANSDIRMSMKSIADRYPLLRNAL